MSPAGPSDVETRELTPISFHIDPHIHMLSRVTDDDHMAKCGCVAASEPAFWAGFFEYVIEPALAAQPSAFAGIGLPRQTSLHLVVQASPSRRYNVRALSARIRQANSSASLTVRSLSLMACVSTRARMRRPHRAPR
jgi:hypothetical protein